MTARCLAAVLLLLLPLAALDARAALTIWQVTLEAAQEVPPTGSAATGKGVVTYDDATNAIRWSFHYKGLGSAATAAHFHGNAARGVNAAVKIGLGTVSGTSGSIAGSSTVLEADEAALLSGQWYVNLHTTGFPGGEIRGQLDAVVTSVTFDVFLEGAQEVPATQAPGGGSGTAVVNTTADTITLNLAFSGMSGTLTGAHLHGPAARGTNAAVKHSIGLTSPITNVVNYAAGDELDILHGLWYANLHTAVFPGGEVRGQLDFGGQGPKPLIVVKSGNGTGTVASDLPGIDCGATCNASFPHGSVVTLTATPAPGSLFGGWGGYCSGMQATCQLTVDITKNAQARFFQPLVHADTNDDRKSDLVWREAPPATGLSWWTMNGAALSGANYYDVPPEWVVVDAADVTGDGKSDLVWRNTANGFTFLWALNGLAPSAYFSLGVLDPAVWTLAGAGDLDRDGRADLVWRNADGTIYAWLMNGGAIAGQGVVANPGTDWVLADIADMDGDNKADLVFRHATTGQVYVWLMDGTAIAGSGSAGTVPPADWSLVAAADFSGDGKADLLWRHTSGDTWVWLMDGTAFVSGGSIGNPGLAWSIRSVGDFDGDGKADILWRHTDGTTYFWKMDAAAVSAFQPVANPGGTWGTVAP
ncbi:MAG TPA: CHRD domain-containing protein [Usitatibacteraceae bacterium]|mgnify:CR=1 FL=1|nr:CHRD domain-containing protein [Usitatibacteraceae bacterium]